MLDSALNSLNSYSESTFPTDSLRGNTLRRTGGGSGRTFTEESPGESPAIGSRRGPISEEAVRDQLARIITSPLFAQSERLGQFLRYTVETTLEGKEETLKEYVIGTRIYKRKPTYQPTEDSIVRSEARRLRRKLHEFYETLGKDDLVFIHYTPGSYVPAFTNHSDTGARASAHCAHDTFVEGNELRVAVLPFLDLSKGTLSGACAQCLTDELIHQLVRTDGVRVTTTCPEREGAAGTPSLAGKPDAQIVFEGTVGEESSQLRVTARVINSEGLRIWSERFETSRDSQFLFNVSARIASALISRVCSLQPLMRKHRDPRGTPAVHIHPLVLKAEALLDEGTAEATRSALAKWREAIEIESDNVTALCGLSQYYCEIALRGTPQSAAVISRANQAAERASQLDSDLPIVLACRGSSYALSWNWDEAESCFKRALNFGDTPGTCRQYAVCLAARGRFREAWTFIQKAQQIDPFSYRQKVIYTRLLYLSRNCENGLKYLSEQLLYGRLPNEAELYRAMMLMSHDRLDEARQIAKDLSEKADAHACIMSGAAEVLAICGDAAAAVRIADDYRLLASDSPISKFRQGLLLVALRNPERAVRVLAEAGEEREAELIWLACDPRLDGLREDSRFARLQNQVMFDSAMAIQS